MPWRVDLSLTAHYREDRTLFSQGRLPMANRFFLFYQRWLKGAASARGGGGCFSSLLYCFVILEGCYCVIECPEVNYCRYVEQTRRIIFATAAYSIILHDEVGVQLLFSATTINGAVGTKTKLQREKRGHTRSTHLGQHRTAGHLRPQNTTLGTNFDRPSPPTREQADPRK